MLHRFAVSTLALCAFACVHPLPAAAQSMTLARLPLPGTPQFVRIAKDVLDVHYRIVPNNAAEAGLFDDSPVVPSFTPAAVRTLSGRLDADMAVLRESGWRSWPVDRQIDARYVYAIAQDAKRQLISERMYEYRPAQWLEPVANTYIALLTYAPQRSDLQQKLAGRIPAMVAEMEAVCAHPTKRNAQTAQSLVDAIVPVLSALPADGRRDRAIASLRAYKDRLSALRGLPDFRVIGAANYAWRLKHVELLPWSPVQLNNFAWRELRKVDAQLAALKPQLEPPPAPTGAQIALAAALDQRSLLAIYDDVERRLRAKVQTLGIITVPAGVGPIEARVTPAAMVPLTGDGGSMNNPPTYWSSNVGEWNVEHFNPQMPQADRLATVVDAQDFELTGMGPYAVHEGVPGHHLQLSIARLNPDPLRSILNDSVQTEGWALYAEDEFQQAGGLGSSRRARYNTLNSWRFRVRRVIYDTNVETGRWSLQQAADWKAGVRAGTGRVDEDITRTINWPAQLICYFAGKMQIVELKAAYKKKLGAAYTERKFNDALLAAGSIPYALIRAKLLGEPVPGFD